TGRTGGIALPADIVAALNAALNPADYGVPNATTAPDRNNKVDPLDPALNQLRNGFSGTNTSPGTLAANTNQQQYFADATTKAVLPTFAADGKPFALVYWSRDPDGTQHNQGDSLNSLTPGINGPTSRAAVKNADNNLKQILAY